MVLLQMSAAIITKTDDDAVEARRRSLMAESDGLLDDVERLHLEDQNEVPQGLREAIRSLQLRLGRTDPPRTTSFSQCSRD